MTRENQTVGQVIARLRRMLGHVGKKDRATVLEAIEAIHELSTRLHEAMLPSVTGPSLPDNGSASRKSEVTIRRPNDAIAPVVREDIAWRQQVADDSAEPRS